jgi:hypothetical protein
MGLPGGIIANAARTGAHHAPYGLLDSASRRLGLVENDIEVFTEWLISFSWLF